MSDSEEETIRIKEKEQICTEKLILSIFLEPVIHKFVDQKFYNPNFFESNLESYEPRSFKDNFLEETTDLTINHPYRQLTECFKKLKHQEPQIYSYVEELVNEHIIQLNGENIKNLVNFREKHEKKNVNEDQYHRKYQKPYYRNNYTQQKGNGYYSRQERNGYYSKQKRNDYHYNERHGHQSFYNRPKKRVYSNNNNFDREQIQSIIDQNLESLDVLRKKNEK